MVESFEEIYKLYFKDVYHFILSLSKDAVEAEEVTQEAFFRAMKHMDRFRGECKMTVWLCQIARNIYFARQKERQRRGETGEIPKTAATEMEPLERRLADASEAMRIHEHLHELPEPYKEVFMLRVFGELPFKKIAHIFGKTENWARVTYYRAKVRLTDELSNDSDLFDL